MKISARTAVAAWIVATCGLVATACYPPSQTPTEQPLPPGGRVVATGPILTEMWIEDASEDLSTILYARSPFHLDGETRPSYRFFVYDDDTGATTPVPMGSGDFGEAALSPNERQVVFASNAGSLQVGPVAANCREDRMWQPTRYHICPELYLFDLDTGETRQLTGLTGSSEHAHQQVSFTEDGTAVEYGTIVTGGWGTPVTARARLDLSTGEVTEATSQPEVHSWTRGTNEIVWAQSTGTLTSQDTTTGVVTTLWSDPNIHYLSSVTGDGRYFVVSWWPNSRTEVFRFIDADTGVVRPITSPWISFDGSRYATVQLNITPDATDRLVIAPLPG